MNRKITLSTLMAVTAALPGFAAFPIGDNAEVFLTGRVAASHDSNLFLSSVDKESDTALEVTPGVELKWGTGAAANGMLYFQEEIIRYNDNSSQNRELSNLGLNFDYDGPKTNVAFDGGWQQIAQNTADVRGDGFLVRQDISRATAASEFDFTYKTSLGIGGNYRETDYKTGGFRDTRVWNLPADLYYEVTPKVDASFGYRYSKYELAGLQRDSTAHFVNVGARGEFTPKLTGQFRIGWNQRKIEAGGGSTNNIGINSSFTYAQSATATHTLGVSNDFGVSGIGQNTEDFAINWITRLAHGPEWSTEWGASFRKTDYFTGRKDDFWELQAAVNYEPSRHFNYRLGISHRDNDSNQSQISFTQTVISLGVSLRY